MSTWLCRAKDYRCMLSQLSKSEPEVHLAWAGDLSHVDTGEPQLELL